MKSHGKGENSIVGSFYLILGFASGLFFFGIVAQDFEAFPLVALPLIFLVPALSFKLYTKRSILLGFVGSYGLIGVSWLGFYLFLHSARTNDLGVAFFFIGIALLLMMISFIQIILLPFWLFHWDRVRGVSRSRRFYQILVTPFLALGVVGFLYLFFGVLKPL